MKFYPVVLIALLVAVTAQSMPRMSSRCSEQTAFFGPETLYTVSSQSIKWQSPHWKNVATALWQDNVVSNVAHLSIPDFLIADFGFKNRENLLMSLQLAAETGPGNLYLRFLFDWLSELPRPFQAIYFLSIWSQPSPGLHQSQNMPLHWATRASSVLPGSQSFEHWKKLSFHSHEWQAYENKVFWNVYWGIQHWNEFNISTRPFAYAFLSDQESGLAQLANQHGFRIAKWQRWNNRFFINAWQLNYFHEDTYRLGINVEIPNEDQLRRESILPVGVGNFFYSPVQDTHANLWSFNIGSSSASQIRIVRGAALLLPKLLEVLLRDLAISIALESETYRGQFPLLSN